MSPPAHRSGALKDPLGDRMKAYEAMEDRRLLPRVPILVRLDGRAFHSLTRKMDRPFDLDFSRAMVDTMTGLVEEFEATVGYTQSDEITLAWHYLGRGGRALPEPTPPFGGRHQKLVSLTASAAGGFFERALGHKLGRAVPAMFDARAWVVPGLAEAANVFLWRQQDATRNSVQMLARAHFSHKQCFKKSTADLLKMLQEQGVHHHQVPAALRYGTFARRMRVESVISYTAEELEALPAKHEAREHAPGTSFPVVRAVVKPLVVELVTLDANQREVLLFGAAE